MPSTTITLEREELVNSAGCEDYVTNEYELEVSFEMEGPDEDVGLMGCVATEITAQVYCEFLGKWVDFELTEDEEQHLASQIIAEDYV